MKMNYFYIRNRKFSYTKLLNWFKTDAEVLYFIYRTPRNTIHLTDYEFDEAFDRFIIK